MFKLLEGEFVVMERRRHWIVYVGSFVMIILLAVIVPSAIWFGIDSGTDLGSLLRDNILYFALLTLIWWFILWIFFFIVWSDNYLDLLIITNMRIIDVEQFLLFNRDVAEVRLENIEDIKAITKGFFKTILNVGDLIVQTAGENREVTITNVYEPLAVKNMISKYQNTIVEKISNVPPK